MKFSCKRAVLLMLGGISVLGLGLAMAGELSATKAVSNFVYQAFGRNRVPFDAALASGGRVVVIGRGGLLSVVKKDGRSVARNIELGEETNFLSVAKGPDGLLRVTDGKGGIWVVNAELEKLSPEFESGQGALFSIQYLADGTGIAVGEFGNVLVKRYDSSDWVVQEFDWQKLLPELSERVGDVAPHLYRICPRGAAGALVVGEYGVMMEWAAGRWIVSQVGEDVGNFFACLVTPSGMDILAGQSGRLFFRSSATAPWKASDPASMMDIYDLTYTDGVLLAVGQGGVALSSSDGMRWALLDTALPSTDWIVRATPIEDGVLLLSKHGYLLIDDVRRLIGSHLHDRASVIRNTQDQVIPE